MRSSNRASANSRCGRRPGRGSSAQRRASRTVGRSVLGVLSVLGGVGLMTYAGAEPAAATRFTPDEQRIVEELPFGFSANSCATASGLPPGAVASLDCGQDAGLDSPLGGRFTRFPDPDSMNRAFQNDLSGRGADYAPLPCPGLGESPATWHYTATPWETAGQIFCGTYKGAPDIEWTRNRQLLLLNVHDGPGLDRLFQWWDRYGNEPPVMPPPFTR